MRELLILFLLFCLQSCHPTKLIQSDECKSYYQFVKENWIKNDDFTYSFKGDPKYWHNEVYKTYVNNNCLVNLNATEILYIFGTPTKTYKSKELNMFSYCLDKHCQNTRLYGGNFLQFNFDGNDVVKEVFTSPGASDIPDY